MKFTEKELSLDLLEFIKKSPTASHCMVVTAEILKDNDFKEIKETEKWNLKAGDKFYIIREDTSMIAGIMGKKAPAESGFFIIGSHTDSPSFKLKPKAVFKKENYIQLGTEVYGGPLFSTWTNKELSLAGRVAVETENGTEIKLIDFPEPILMIPQLAIHFNRDANTALNLNPQDHLAPIMGLTEENVTDDLIKNMVAEKLSVDKDNILNYELELYDNTDGTLAGIKQEFVCSRHIDNKSMVHASLIALIEAEASDKTILCAFYDSEEIGSSTLNGGNSSFTKDVLERLSILEDNSPENYFRAVANSMFVSADGAHAIHPNYAGSTEPNNKIFLNKGPAIKMSAKGSYANNLNVQSYFETACKKADVPYQKFVNRSDVRGGGTIGSMIATNLGIKTMDIGSPMLAMHSTREVAGVLDHYYMTKVFEEMMK